MVGPVKLLIRFCKSYRSFQALPALAEFARIADWVIGLLLVFFRKGGRTLIRGKISKDRNRSSEVCLPLLLFKNTEWIIVRFPIKYDNGHPDQRYYLSHTKGHLE